MALIGTSTASGSSRGQLVTLVRGRSAARSGARGSTVITSSFSGASRGRAFAVGVLGVVRLVVLSITPTVEIPSAVITVTGTLLTQVTSIEIHFPDNTVVSIPSAQFLTQTTGQITFTLPPHPTNAFYVGPAFIRPIGFNQGLGDFPFTYAARPVMVDFVGGPMDGQTTVNAGVPLDVPIQIYSDYGVGRQQPDGYNVWADYQYFSSVAADPQYAAHYVFHWIPGSTGQHPQSIGGLPPSQTQLVNTPLAQVSLSGVDPVAVAIGQMVTVRGSGLLSVSQLNIDGVVVPSSAFTQVTNVSITFLMPLVPVGEYLLTVTNPSGLSNSLPITVTYVVAGSSISSGALKVS